jgi:hypothetical protein
MKSRRAFSVILSAVLVATACAAAFAKGPKTSTTKGTPLSATFSTINLSTTTGVFDDLLGAYDNGISGVQCYIGVAGKDLDLVTYNTSPVRTLHFKFDRSSTAWQLSGIPADFKTVSDFYGVNYYGRYTDQAPGTTAQVSASIEFYVGRVTYELNYQALASYRESANTWLITSEPNDPIFGYPGFTPSDQADLAVVRRNSNKTFGSVNMPIRFEVTFE